MLVSPSDWTALVPGSSGGDTKKKGKSLGFWDAWSLGVGIVNAGQIYGWNVGLQFGFTGQVAALMVASAGFFCMSFCLSEMASFFPFGGGCYGYCRCIIHPYVGFIVGLTQLLEYILYVSSAMGMMKTWWFVVLLGYFSVQFCGSTFLWTVCKGLAMVATIIIVMYFLACLPLDNMRENTDFHRENWQGTQGFKNFMQIYPTINFSYACFEALLLNANETPNATKTIPNALMACMCTLFVTNMMSMFTAVSVAPGSDGILAEVATMNPGFMAAFDISMERATLLTLPSTFATGLGLYVASNKLLAAMADSRVYPKILSNYWACSFVVCGVAYAGAYVTYNGTPEVVAAMFNVCLMFTCVIYMAIAVCYIICAGRYSSLQRNFTSPLGVYGAVFTFAVFGLMFIALAFFMADYSTLILWVVINAVGTIYYFGYATRVEQFSEDEVKTFMKAYIINANIRRKQHIQRNSKKRMKEMHKQAAKINMLRSVRKVSPGCLVVCPPTPTMSKMLP
eukprot:scaffold8165_cov177-Ochromonas_danica.AAC.10